MLVKLIALFAIVVGTLGLLMSFEKLPVEKWVDPGEMDMWQRKYGLLAKILGPIFIVVGILFLFGIVNV